MPPTSPSTSPPPATPAASPEQPVYGGTTTSGRICMTNGHHLASATRRPDHTIMVHTLQAPLGRLRAAVARRPLLRGLVLLPAQIADTLTLFFLEHPTSHADPSQPAPGRTAAPGSLTRTAGLVAAGWVLGAVAGTQLILSGAAALGANRPWLAGLLAALALVARPLVRRRLGQRTAPDDLAALHGAEHQAINCAHHGLALTDANIAQSPVASPHCDSSLQVTDQAIVVPAAVALEGWLPAWPLWVQLVAGLGFYLAARPLAFELNSRQAARQASGRHHGLLGVLGHLGLRRQARATTRPGGPAQREVAARALAPLLPPEQQALVGPFPSPVVLVSLPATAAADEEAAS